MGERHNWRDDRIPVEKVVGLVLQNLSDVPWAIQGSVRTLLTVELGHTRRGPRSTAIKVVAMIRDCSEITVKRKIEEAKSIREANRDHDS